MSNLADKYPRISDLRKRALRRIPHFAAEYLFSGTGYDRAMDYNQEILKNVFLTPRYLKGTVVADLKTKLFDRVYDAPFGIAPIGMTKLASEVNIPYTLSTVACASIENVGQHLDNKGWFQLYPPKDKNIRDDLLKRAWEVAEKISNGPNLIYSSIKEVLRETENEKEIPSFEILRSLETVKKVYGSQDLKEGASSFVKKTDPKWQDK